MTSPVCEPPRANLKDLRCRISVFGACCDSSVFIRAIRGSQLRHRLIALVSHNRNACHDHRTRSGCRPNPTLWMSSAIVLANDRGNRCCRRLTYLVGTGGRQLRFTALFAIVQQYKPPAMKRKISHLRAVVVRLRDLIRVKVNAL
jgi:hypothetical protein